MERKCHIILLSFALFLSLGMLASSVFAQRDLQIDVARLAARQEAMGDKVVDLERRMNSTDVIAVQLEHRLTVLETYAVANRDLAYGNLAAVLALVFEAIWRLRKKKNGNLRSPA